MENPFSCGASTRVRILTLVSLVLALALVVTAALVFKETYEFRESSVHQFVRRGASGLDSIGQIFGKESHLDDVVDQPLRVVLACSAATFAAGGLQILSSVFFYTGSTKKSEFQSRAPSRIFGFSSILGLITILITLACLFCTNKVWNQEENTIEQLAQYWLIAMFGDAALLLYGIYASFK
ncbi:unnamed protein product [Allacma fusca]|uniref:Transmembrane protein n=1 Tax=Allacma fusca TaxID=39272 RepID=A0A8J2NX69_9HEXA|nr:unnamed protein product [Allacma fusca]